MASELRGGSARPGFGLGHPMVGAIPNTGMDGIAWRMAALDSGE